MKVVGIRNVKNGLSVVRYRYRVAHVLEEILRDDFDSSESTCDSKFASDSSEHDNENQEAETADKVADECCETDVTDDVTDEVIANNGDDDAMNDDREHDDAHNDGDIMHSRCGSILWRQQCPPPARYPPHNLLTEDRGVADGVEFDTIADAFRIFVDGLMMRYILECTNLYAADIKAQSSRFRWNELSAGEMYAFLGLALLAGVQKARNQQLKELWDDQWGYPVFRATMSFGRFTDITRALRFDDKSTRNQRIAETGYQGAAVQEIFDMFLEKCRSSYNCGASVTVDEQLISFHGNCRFRMFIPSKPGKYGLKLWIMTDSETFYCADAQLYAGKVGNQTDVGQGTRVVLQLTVSIAVRKKCYNRQLFTNYQLATELQQRRLSSLERCEATGAKFRKRCSQVLIVLCTAASSASTTARRWCRMYQNLAMP